jgi:hypothetical protein
MKHFSQQLYKKATTTVKLQAAEKRELKERLVAYMEYHPLPAHLKTVETKESDTKTAAHHSDPFTHVSIPFAYLFKLTSFAAVFMLLVVPFVAERAVPGDVLYAVKVQFNEEVRSTLTFDTYQKVEWETERLNRRIAEARLLASEGRLTVAVEAEVAEAVRTHTANAQREIDSLRTLDADAATIASIALDTTLEVQSSSLKGEEDAAIALSTSATSTERTGNLITDAIDESRSQSEGKNASSTLPAYNKLVARVEQNTTRIYELLSALREITPDAKLAEVTRRVEDTDRAIQAATDLGEVDGVAAQHALVEALQRSQRLIVYMTEMMVLQTVDIATLIPIVLTETEEDTQVASVTQEVLEKTAQVKVLLEQIEDEAVIEKIEFAIIAIEKQLSHMASSTKDFEAFKLHSGEAAALVNDSLLLLEKSEVVKVIEITDGIETASSSATSTEAVIEVNDQEDTSDVEPVTEENRDRTQEPVSEEEVPAEDDVEAQAPESDSATSTPSE